MEPTEQTKQDPANKQNQSPPLAPETLEALGLAPKKDEETPEEPQGVVSTMLGVGSSIFMGILNWLIIPGAIVLILHNFVFQAFHVVGSSMFPTLHESDYLIISKVDHSIADLTHKTYVPSRGQIVVFHYPKDPSLIFVKRVIGLPGEHVIVKDGRVTVINKEHPNGFEPDTSGDYKPSDPVTLGAYDDVIPDGSIFVVGDNRTPNGSYDSREWGPLPTNLIVGQAVMRLLPLDGFKFLAIPYLELAT